MKKQPSSESPSPLASALAADMRNFDSELDDDQLVRIAEWIDKQRAANSALNPSAKRLHNGEEPVTRFDIEDRRV